MTDQPTDTRRAEAERAWEAYHDRHLTATELERLDLRDAFLAGDAAGYARCLAELEQLAIHYGESARYHTDWPEHQKQDANTAVALHGAVQSLRAHWECRDQRHTCCQKSQQEGERTR